MSALRPYLVHDGRPEDVAVLVFASHGTEAQEIGWMALDGYSGAAWADVRAVRLCGNDAYWLSLRQDTSPHWVKRPPACQSCFQWAIPLPVGESICSACKGE